MISTDTTAPGLETLHLTERDRLLIIGGYGVRNLGDEAILSGMLAQVPADVPVTVVSRSPQATTAMHGVHATGPTGAAFALLRSSAVVVGGGGLFSGHMGPFAKLIPLVSGAARLKGARLAFHGIGVYPSTPAWVRVQLLQAMHHAQLVTVRDNASAAFLKSHSVRATVVPDLSTVMPEYPLKDEARKLLEHAGVMDGKPIVGLCLTAAEPALAPAVRDMVPALLDTFPNIHFLFIPTSQHPSVLQQNDTVLAKQLALLSPRLKVLAGWKHPALVLACFRHLSAVVSMRYHGLLFADRAGIPAIAISYAEKTTDWARQHQDSAAPPEPLVIAQRLSAVLAAARA